MISHSAEDTQLFANELVQKLRGGETILLQGELGSGKTTFVQGLADALDITDPVRSPTFILRQDFSVANHPTITRLVHIDLYRLDESADLSSIDLDETLRDPHTLTVIEWPERAGSYPWPAHAKRLTFEHGTQPAERVLNLTKNSI